MEGIENAGRELHPRTLRFGGRLTAGINPDGHHGRRRHRHRFRPAASQQIIAGADQSPSPSRKHCAGSALRPPAESGRCRSRRETCATRSGPLSRLGLPARAPISPRLNRRRSGRNVPGSMRRFGPTAHGPSIPRQRVAFDSRKLGVSARRRRGPRSFPPRPVISVVGQLASWSAMTR